MFIELVNKHNFCFVVYTNQLITYLHIQWGEEYILFPIIHFSFDTTAFNRL